MSPEYEKWQKTSVYSSDLYDSEITTELGWDGVLMKSKWKRFNKSQ